MQLSQIEFLAENREGINATAITPLANWLYWTEDSTKK